MTRGESKTSPRRLRAVDKQLAALKYRGIGHTYAQIAVSLGYRVRSGAFRAMRAALQYAARAPVENEIALDAERLNSLTVAMMPRALSGDPGAIAGVLAIMERRAALLGVDAPVKKEAAIHGVVLVLNGK